jgi:cytochrome c oxidase subunit 2
MARIVEGYQPVMPPYQGQLTEEQVFALIAYIRSLANVAPGTPPAAPAAPTAGGGQAGTADPALEAGRQIFTTLGCSACHLNARTPGAIGPPLGGVPGSAVTLTDGTTVTADDAYLRESIRTPAAKVVQGYQPVMPPLPVTDEQMEQLLAYIKSLPAVD